MKKALLLWSFAAVNCYATRLTFHAPPSYSEIEEWKPKSRDHNSFSNLLSMEATKPTPHDQSRVRDGNSINSINSVNSIVDSSSKVNSIHIECQTVSKPELQTDINSLFSEEAELADYVTRWEWLPAFPRRFQTWQSQRASLLDGSTKTNGLPTIHLPHLHVPLPTDESMETKTKDVFRLSHFPDALAPRSVGAYFFAHFLSSYDARPVHSYNFRKLTNDQRSELYAAMHEHCFKQDEKGLLKSWAYMEVKICHDIQQLESMLRRLRTSKLPALLAEKQALVQKEHVLRVGKQNILRSVETPREKQPLRFRRFSWILFGGANEAKNEKKALESLPKERRRHSWSHYFGFSLTSKDENNVNNNVNNNDKDEDDNNVNKNENLLHLVTETKTKTKKAAALTLTELEPNDTEEWRQLRQEIAFENMALTQIFQECSVLAARFREAFTEEHERIMEKARNWSKEATPIEQLFLKKDAGGYS